MFRGFSLNPEGIKWVSGSDKSGQRAGGGVGRKTGIDYIYELFIFKKNVPVKKKKPTRQKNIISDRVTKFATRAKKSKKYPCKEKWACWKRKMAKKVSMQIKKCPSKIDKMSKNWLQGEEKNTVDRYVRDFDPNVLR